MTGQTVPSMGSTSKPNRFLARIFYHPAAHQYAASFPHDKIIKKPIPEITPSTVFPDLGYTGTGACETDERITDN